MGPLKPPRNALRWGTLLLLAATWVAALDPSLCASFNTASMGKNISIYQTNGLCHDFCLQKNQAYAITQGNACWCSDYTPAKGKQVDKGDCNQPCPAYPAENCGGSGLFGYIALNNVLPSGTKGDTDPRPKPTPSSKSSTEERETPTTSSDPVTSDSTSTLAPTSVIQTVTADGTVQTVTVMPTSTPAAKESSQSAEIRPEKSGLNVGGIVGLVVGIVLAVLAATAMGLFIFYQRKKRHDPDFQDDPSVRGSSSGMLGGRPDMAGAPGSPGSTGNRSSTLQIDPRMDPFKQGLYARSGSHESINTLRDEHDYSRRIQQPKVLRATNPDPTDD